MLGCEVPHQTKPTSLLVVVEQYESEKDMGVWEYGSRSVWNDEKNFWAGDYHPNALGYKIIAEHMYEQIKDLIAEKKKDIHDKQIIIQKQIVKDAAKIDKQCVVDPEVITILNNSASGK